MVCGQVIGQAAQDLQHLSYQMKWVQTIPVKTWVCLTITWLIMVGLHLEELKEMHIVI